MRQLKKPFLQAYEEYVAQTESPTEYNTWCGISAICSSLKKNVFIPEKYTNGFYKIYPNQYIILVGPPGVGKGTAINPAIELVKKASTANYISDRVTAEKIVEQLSKGYSHSYKTPAGQFTTLTDNSATIVSTELPVFLQASEWMLPLMCEMWDRNEFSYATKNKGSLIASNICVSLVGGCVPDYIRKLNRDANSAVTGGFTSRCIFVYASEKSRTIAWPNINGNFSKLEAEMIADLQEMSIQSGEFSFTKSAMKMWEHQYINMKLDPFESEVLTGFKSRMKSHIFKTAMALSMSEGSTMEINDRHLFNAIKAVEGIRDKVDMTFRSLGDSPLASQQDRVLRFITAKKLCSAKEIYRVNAQHMTYIQFEQILYILEMAGRVKKHVIGKTPMYEPI